MNRSKGELGVEAERHCQCCIMVDQHDVVDKQHNGEKGEQALGAGSTKWLWP